ncbi:MAG: hypothetical protein ACRCU5_14170 [Rhizobiaceae bacterium]
MNIRKIARNWADTARLLAGIGGMILAVKALLIPYLADKDEGPAWAIESIFLEGGAPGEKVRLLLSVDKLRPCAPKPGSLIIVDSNGSSFVVGHNIGANPILMGKNTNIIFHWEIPADIAPGEITSGHFEIWHHNCQKGDDPTEPATIETNTPKIRNIGNRNIPAIP